MKKNSFVQSFVSKANGRYNKDSADMSHGDWMCANTSLNKRPFSFDRYPFQKQIADDMHPNMDVIKPSQVGLALALDTPVRVLGGFSNMGALEVGDVVFDENLRHCNVTYVSPIYQDHDCFEIKFKGGEKIIADAGHRWKVETYVNFLGIKLHREVNVHPTHRLAHLVTGRTIRIPTANGIGHHYIQSIKACDPVPVRCISVDSPSHLFLCGRGMIPTHNTEIQIRKAITLLIRTPNTSLIYTMPNERMFKRISKARIQPLLKYDKAFRQDAQDKTQQSMDLMRIGTSYLYVTGSSEADATSINADFVFNDEIDLTPPDMLSLFNSRLQGSDHRVSQRFSTPTYEGFGVDKGYARSDQHEYILKCAACNHHQVPLFNRDFVRVDGMPDDCDSFIHLSSKLVDSGQVKLETAKVYCEKCHKPLNLADHDNREWVAKYPSRTLNRGYRVRTFSTHRLDPVYCFTQMFKYLEKDNLKGFHNTVLGEPYTNEDQKMSDSDVDAMFGYAGCPPIDNTLPHFIGIDVGKTCHIVVARMEGTEKIRVVEFMTCPSSAIQSFVDSMRAKYNIISGLMDRYPYTPTANAIREASDGKIAPAHYTVNKPIALVTNGLDKLDYVQINRTHVLDSVFFGIKKRNLFLDGFGKFKTMIIEHLVDMVREENDEKIPVWVKLNGNDHFFHALGYMFGSIEYYRYVEGKEPFVNLTVGLSGIRHSNMLMSGESEDFFGAQDLIGFGNSYSPDKIITRY